VQSRMVEIDLETLLKIAGKPYQGPNYTAKRRKLTKMLKQILTKHLSEKASQVISIFTTSRGFKSSEELLKYGSKAFENTVNGIIAVCRAIAELDDDRERELRKDILEAVIEVKNDP